MTTITTNEYNSEWLASLEIFENTARIAKIELDGEGGTASAKSFKDADIILQKWASKEHASGGYCKTWYTVTATNGTSYSGRIDLLRKYMLKSNILQGEMKQYLNWIISGNTCGFHITVQQVNEAREQLAFWKTAYD